MFLLYWAGQCPPAVSCKSMPVPARYKGKGHWLEQQYFFLLCSYRTYYKIVKSVLLCWRPELQYPTCCAANPTGLPCEIVSFVLGGTMPASSLVKKERLVPARYKKRHRQGKTVVRYLDTVAAVRSYPPAVSC